MRTDYLIETTLHKLNPDLHSRYRSCVSTSLQMLSRYEGVFPDFTDHTSLHTLEIIDFCNSLMGSQISRLNAESLYVLLMGALFHDVGMGVSEQDFERFLKERNIQEKAPKTPEEIKNLIRSYHHELSGWYIRKYWELFDIPGEDYARAIIQVCRGHRKVDLFDEKEYPSSFFVSENIPVPLPYLASLVRLADEMDIAADRNFSFLYELDKLPNYHSKLVFSIHKSIHRIALKDDHMLVQASSSSEEVKAGIREVVEKLQNTLEYCRKAVAERSSFSIEQARVQLEWIDAEVAI
ncbi:MAG: hypothetical protein Q4B50_05880 [Bacillota bacterium]|nr:hypothetical protein [Bacillota bacterium]